MAFCFFFPSFAKELFFLSFAKVLFPVRTPKGTLDNNQPFTFFTMGNLFSSDADRENQRRAAEFQQRQALKAQQQREREAAEYQQQLLERAAAKVRLEMQQRLLEGALRRQRERELEEYRQRWPSLHDQSLSSPSFSQSQQHGRAFIDPWEEWGDSEKDKARYYHSQTSPTAVSNAHEDVDLGAWRKNRAANKNHLEGRRVRGRKPKGDLFEDDYHAGHTKDEIKSMCRERQAGFEACAQKKTSAPMTSRRSP